MEVVREEEERFAATLDRGLALLESEVARVRQAGERTLAGEVAFRLYDTYGFPLDLTEDILAAESVVVDRAGFERAMEAQRERARGAKRFTDAEAAPGIVARPAALGTRFVGDRVAEWESEVLALVAEGRETRGPLGAGAEVDVVTAETPFYAESGGQVGDRGWLETPDGATRIEVLDTQKLAPTVVAHRGVVRQGTVSVGDRVRLRIDVGRREAARLNHSATHLVHAALRHRLGTHVRQSGSLVTPERLRFDFTHTRPVGEQPLAEIEDEVNAQIRANLEVWTEEMSYDGAVKAGALAFFGEKYGDRVTVVHMGEYSVELCGGTHVARTGDIGLFKVRGEGGVAAGAGRARAAACRGHRRPRRPLPRRQHHQAARTARGRRRGRAARLRAGRRQGPRPARRGARRGLRPARRREPLNPWPNRSLPRRPRSASTTRAFSASCSASTTST